VDKHTRWLFGVGAALAVLVGTAAYFTLTNSARAGRASGTVVVARKAIPERTLFTAANVDELLTEREIPADALPEQALGKPHHVIGKSTVRALVAGEMLLDSPDRLASGEGGTARPAAAIPRDKVALTVPANESISVAGSLQPGDRVDVIATWQPQSTRPVTQAIFQDVRVFAVGPWQGEVRGRVQGVVGGQGIPSSVTLLLDYQQAVAVQHLQTTGGHLSLALRRFDQAGDQPIDAVTPDLLTRRYFGQHVDTPTLATARPGGEP
jgi:pilus assembly protein CpaB